MRFITLITALPKRNYPTISAVAMRRPVHCD
jgi:hypothetical protein